MRYWTSDLHLNHERLIYLEQNRKSFRNSEEMNEVIINSINETVGPDDTLWILGDAVMGQRDESLELLDSIVAKKFLVPGNHDYNHPMFKDNKKYEHWRNEYKKHFHSVFSSSITTSIHDIKVSVSHFPYDLDERHGNRFSEWYLPKDENRWIIHGHVHSMWQVNQNQLNVGWDAWGYPLSDDEIADIIMSTNI